MPSLNAPLQYLVVENAPDVCEGIIRRMNAFPDWKSLGYCVGIKDTIEAICTKRPQLIFLDWSLNGGSAFEVLQTIQNIADYKPYIIFNTGFQKDNPEIPQEIINNYQVDKYLVKPIWEHLRLHLADYLKEAAHKSQRPIQQSTVCWLENVEKVKYPADMSQLICVCQDPTEPRTRLLYFHQWAQPLRVSMQWHKIYDLLDQFEIPYFITKTRSHLVVKSFIDRFEKPFVRLKGLPAFKIDVVKENIKSFENWLVQKEKT